MSYIGNLPRTQKGGRIAIATVSTTSAVSGLAFVDGSDGVVMDNSYDSYEWHLINLHPDTDNAHVQFQVNATDDAGGGYDTSPITTTAWNWYNGASKTATFNYEDGNDQSNDAGYQYILSRRTGNAAKESVSGILRMDNPGSTVLSKNFMSWGVGYHNEDYVLSMNVAGYISDPTAIDEINFRFDTGNIESGTIRMYGVKNDVT